MFFQCINIIVSWIVRYKVYQYHDIRVFYIVSSIYQCYCYLLTSSIRWPKCINFVYICVIEFFDIYVKHKIKTICVNNCAYKCVVLCWGCASVLCAVLCVVLCAAYCRSLCCVCAYCVHIVCICIVEVLHICVFCILCRCMIVVHGMQIYVCAIAYVCAYVCAWGVRLRLCSTQSDTPLYGYLCGYRVRIIKAKKTQP